MGTYNNSIVEVLDEQSGKWSVAEIEDIFPVKESYQDLYGKTTGRPFRYQSYAVSSFVAGVRNYYRITPITEMRGLPDDYEDSDSPERFSEHAKASRYPDDMTFDCANTWVLLSDFLDFDYDKVFEDRRSYGSDDSDTVAVGQGKMTTYREHLGEFFFKELDVLRGIGRPSQVRIVFSFS